MHDPFGGRTLLDLNRAGTPLIEIISEPDMHSSDQAAAYVRKVQSIMKRIGASDADMEKVWSYSHEWRNNLHLTSFKGIYAYRC